MADFGAFIAELGFQPPQTIVPGRWLPFATTQKRGDNAGRCLLFEDQRGGLVHDWRTGRQWVWQRERDRKLTKPELAELKRLQQEATALAQAGKAQRAQTVAEKAHERWHAADEADPAHEYLATKGIKPHGIRQDGELLLVPLHDAEDHLSTLQTIAPDGTKRFLPGGQKKGRHYFMRDAGVIPAVIVVCEGFATGASIREATGHAVAVAFDAGNLALVASEIRRLYPAARLILAADDDHQTQGNPGMARASEAAAAVGASLAAPRFSGVRSKGQTDFNDLARAEGPEAVRACIEAAKPVLRTVPQAYQELEPSGDGAPPRKGTLAAQPRFPRIWIDDAKPTLSGRYIIKGVLDLGNFAVIFGPSGDGKTFFAADMVGHVASGIPWRGHRVHQGLVVYVAAEAGTSILKRFFAWRERHLAEGREDRIPLAIVTRGANLLNMADVEALLDELRAISHEAGMPIAVVVFDTLSRSMAGGDENSATDMTAIVSAADYIRDTIGAATVLVHHSGKDVTKGARGHSSLFAAADCVISVVEKTATLDKARDGETGKQFPFELDVVHLGDDEDGDPVTTCIVTPTDKPSASTGKGTRAALSGVARVALLALREAIDERGEKKAGTSSIPSGVRAVHIKDWRARFVLRYGEDESEGTARDAEAVRKAFNRGREALLKAEAIGISSPLCWLTVAP